MKILVVCHGNINRSPACEAVLKKELPTHEIRSAGFVMSAKRAAKKMREAMKAHGYDLDAHVPQPVTESLVRWADMVVYMDNGNYNRLGHFTGGIGKSRCLASSVGLKRIPDPAFMAKDSDEFRDTVRLIIIASNALADTLKE